MNAAATLLSMLLLLLSVPIFMVFGLGSASVAILGMDLPWSTLIQVSFGSMTKHVLIAVPLFIFTGMVMLLDLNNSKVYSESQSTPGPAPRTYLL